MPANNARPAGITSASHVQTGHSDSADLSCYYDLRDRLEKWTSPVLRTVRSIHLSLIPSSQYLLVLNSADTGEAAVIHDSAILANTHSPRSFSRAHPLWYLYCMHFFFLNFTCYGCTAHKSYVSLVPSYFLFFILCMLMCMILLCQKSSPALRGCSFLLYKVYGTIFVTIRSV